MPCKLLKSIGSFWYWTCCINANWCCFISVKQAFLFRQDLGKWRHIWQRGFRFSYSSNLPLRSKSCRICINHYQSLVLFLSFTKYKRKSLPAVLELIGVHFKFLRQNFHFLQKPSKPRPVLPKAQRKPLCCTSPLAGKLPLLQPQEHLRKCCHVAHSNPAC